MSVSLDDASLSFYPDAESMSISSDDNTFYSVSLAPKFDHNSLLFPDILSQIHRTDYIQSVGFKLKDLFDNPLDFNYRAKIEIVLELKDLFDNSLDFYRAKKEIALPFTL